MRMTFGADDEGAYHRRRDELRGQFAQWLNTHDVSGDPNDAVLLMDWKWSHDGRLDRWSVPDVHEFLFGWCTRKLSAAPADCAEIPLSVAAFVEFLADTGMLAAGSAAPAKVRRHCERNVDAFVREMGNPANFGPDPSLDHLAEDAEPPAMAPVRLPPDSERLAVARATPVMGQLRALAAYCAPPGRKLTSKGTLEEADARHLVAALGTGDDPEPGRAGEELPELSRLVDLALAAGVVRRQRDSLVAVARFAALDECAAHQKVVLAAVTTGLTGPESSAVPPAVAELHTVVHAWAVALLADLLHAGSEGVDVEQVDAIMGEFLQIVLPGLPGFISESLTSKANERVDALADLGVLTISEDGQVALTAAGVWIAIELLGQVGVAVPIRPDPAGATAAAIVGLFGEIGREELHRDAADWFAAQPDRLAAAEALAAECLAAHRDTITAMTGIAVLDELATDEAVDVLWTHLDGPHDGPVLHWLVRTDALDPRSVDPGRLMSGTIDVLAAALDTSGPAGLVASFSDGQPDGGVGLLDQIWRLEHPRLSDVLGAIGAHHPVKAVAKAARKALMRHNSRYTGVLSNR
jgi:hypothetical protein